MSKMSSRVCMWHRTNCIDRCWFDMNRSTHCLQSIITHNIQQQPNYPHVYCFPNWPVVLRLSRHQPFVNIINSSWWINLLKTFGSSFFFYKCIKAKTLDFEVMKLMRNEICWFLFELETFETMDRLYWQHFILCDIRTSYSRV